MVERTVEIRWFANGAVAPAWRRWFTGPAHPVALEVAECRTDFYIGGCNDPDIGLKHRGNGATLEIKTRDRATPAKLDYGPFRGTVELWSKWQVALDVDARGLAVEKRRLQRMIRCDSDGSAELPLQSRSFDGCAIELTEIMVAGEPWATLGFEAFGDEGKQTGCLEEAVKLMLSRDPPPQCFGDAMSYPEWLAACFSDGQR